uniref:Uncharacterized protein n=1 Tax=Anguilla anguilla TaxID=7936 RepID=A0A0E9Q128_ANGAN
MFKNAIPLCRCTITAQFGMYDIFGRQSCVAVS